MDPRWACALVEAPRRFLMLLVRGYRLFVSPALGASCRFEPSCSSYALDALDRHGAVAGAGLAVVRVMRCGPWCAGGHDPVPTRLYRWFPRKAPRIGATSLFPTPPTPPTPPTLP